MRLGSPRAIETLRAAIAEAGEAGLDEVAAVGRHNLGMALARAGELDEALAVEEESVVTYGASGQPSFEAFSHAYLAEILMLRGDLGRAEEEARRGTEVVRELPAIVPFMHTTLARVLLLAGRAEEAHALMAPLAASLDGLYSDEGEELARLALAESLEAIGDHGAACDAIRVARDRLFERVSKISDAELRASCLENIAENRRILELATAWLAAC
jgi:tetratricopeptide (TPR) repeat protein